MLGSHQLSHFIDWNLLLVVCLQNSTLNKWGLLPKWCNLCSFANKIVLSRLLKFHMYNMWTNSLLTSNYRRLVKSNLWITKSNDCVDLKLASSFGDDRVPFCLRSFRMWSKNKQNVHFPENFRRGSELQPILQLLIHQLEFIECCYVQNSVDIRNEYNMWPLSIKNLNWNLKVFMKI